MKKLRKKGKYTISLLLILSFFIQISLPAFTSLSYADIGAGETIETGREEVSPGDTIAIDETVAEDVYGQPLQGTMQRFSMDPLAANSVGLSIRKEVNAAEVMTGEKFSYRIHWSVNDIERDYQDVIVIDNMDPRLEYINYTPNSVIKYVTNNSGNLTIGISNMDDNKLQAGTTGYFDINVKVKDGTQLDGVTIPNTATIQEGANGTPSSSDVVIVKTKGAKSYWKTTKVRISPSNNPIIGDEGVLTTYRVGLRDEDVANPYGHLNLTNVVLVDTLPQGSVFISSTQGSYDPTSHAVTWSIGNVNTSEKPTMDITVLYSAKVEEIGFALGDTVTNKVSATGKELNTNAATIPSAENVMTFAGAMPPNPGEIGFYKSRDFQYRYHGQEQSFHIGNIKNNGNTPLQNFIVTDEDLSTKLDYESITLENPQEHPYTLQYKTKDHSSWQSYNNNPISGKDTSITVTDFVYGAGDYITGLKWDFGTVPAEFDAGKITIKSKVNNTAVHDEVVTNTAKLTYSYDDKSETLSDTVTFTIKNPKPWLNPSKSHNKSQTSIPGDIVGFTLNIANRQSATGPYNNPIIYDLLPKGLSYVPATENSSQLTVTPKFEVIATDFNGTGRTLLKWSWPNGVTNFSMPVGGSITIKYDAKIQVYTPATTGSVKYINDLYITTHDGIEDQGFWWGNVDGHNWDSEKDSIKNKSDKLDSTVDEYLVHADAEVYINEDAVVKATKWNKGELPGTGGSPSDYDVDGYNKYPAQGNTIAGGTADYKLTIENTGNAYLKQIEILDILPYVGDTAVLNGTERKSEWRPNLIGKIPSGTLTQNGVTFDVKVYYGISSDKTYASFTSNKGDANYWLEAIPANFDITSIRSLYFVIDTINDEKTDKGLAPGEKVQLNWKMRAPVGTPNDKLAWNSFATKLTTMTNNVLNPTEPIKVGFKVINNPTEKGEIGDFVWFDKNNDGIQNDGYDLQYAGINGIKAILYKEHSGNFIKVDETLTANDHNGKPGYYMFTNLDAGKYYIVFELPSYYDATLKNASGSTPVNDSDGFKVDSIIRTSDITLASDNMINHDTDLGLIAATGPIGIASMEIAKSAVAVVDKPSLNPGLKSSNENPVNKGEKILYQIEVKNTGSVPLHNVKVQDEIKDKAGSNQTGFSFKKASFDKTNMIVINANPNVISYPNEDNGKKPYVIINKIDVGQTFYLQGEYTVKATDVNTSKPLENIASVWSNETNAAGHTDPKTATEKVEIADISITKASDLSSVEPGVDGKDGVTYTITVTNNGNVTMENIKVTDAIEGTTDKVTFNSAANLTINADQTVTILSFAPGASQNITATYKIPTSVLNKSPASAKIVKNTVTANHGDIRYTVSANKTVGTKALKIEKTADKAVYKVGDTIIYTIKITNNGSIPLNGVQVISDLMTSSAGANQDMKASITGSIPPSLAAGASVSLILNYIITAANIDNSNTQKIVNTVKVKSDSTTPQPEATATVDVVYVEVEKTIKSGTPAGPYKVGDTITYEIKVTNKGSKDLTNLAVNDNLYNKNKGIGFTTIKPYAISSLAKGATHTEEVVYVLTTADLASLENQKLKNVAVVTVPDTGEVLKSEKDVDTKGIALEKTGVRLGSGQIKVGDQIKYTFKVKNTGSATLNGVTITDPKLSLTINVGSLTPGQERVIDEIYTVRSSDIGPGPIENKATVTTNEGVEAEAKHYIGDASIKVIKNVVSGHHKEEYIKSNYGSGLPKLQREYKDDSVTYVFTIINTGFTYLNNITLTDAQLGITQNNLTLIPELSDVNAFDSSTNLKGYSEGRLVLYYETTMMKALIDNHMDSSDFIINTATVLGNPSDRNGTDIPYNPNPTDTDTAKNQILARIGDYIWLDFNEDGIQDADEKGITGVKVQLKNAAGDVVKETTTSANGYYLFEELGSGIYTVVIAEKPEGLKATYDPDYASNVIYDDKSTVTIAKGESNLAQDFGYNYTASLEGTVWYDFNENGLIDKYDDEGVLKDEQRISNVTIYLKDVDGNILRTTITDTNGKYSFDKLPGGKYNIEVDKSTLLKDIYIVFDYDGDLNHKTVVDLPTANGYINSINFGYNYTGSIGDRVWYDLNANGLQDAGEPGVANVVVELYQKDIKIAQTVTDKDGVYLFEGLEKGNYAIKVVKAPKLSGYTDTYDLDGGYDSKANLYLNSGDHRRDVDFGYVYVSSGGGGGTNPNPNPPVIPPVTPPITPEPPVNPEAPVIPQPPVNPEPQEPTKPIEETTEKEKPVDGKVETSDGSIPSIGTEPKNGAVIIDKDGNWKYTPKPGFVGKDSFTIKVVDKDGNEKEVFVEIDVEEIPLGTPITLPKTGESDKMMFYLAGLFMILMGIVLRKRIA